MIQCVSVETMRRSDGETIRKGTSGRELIRRAAQGVYRAVQWQGRTAIVVGSGNNGADGFALACLLHEAQQDCTVFTVSSWFHEDGAYFAQLARDRGVEVLPYAPGCLGGYDIIADCILGTGFRGQLREEHRRAIEEINASDAYVVSVDINSGMDGDTGTGTTVVQSDLTVAIEFVKQGQVTEQAGVYMKRLECVSIGIELHGELLERSRPSWLK